MKRIDAKAITKPLINWLDKNNQDKVITTEISINTSIGVKVADVVVANGHLVAYEIKSELDNTLRLYNQIQGYREVFDYVYVVYWDSKFELESLNLPKNIGAVRAYFDEDENIVFKVTKKAYKNYQLDIDTVAKMLWKDELFYYLNQKNATTKKSFDKEQLCKLFVDNYTKTESLKILKNSFKGRFNKGFQAFKKASEDEDALRCLVKNKKDMNYLSLV